MKKQELVTNYLKILKSRDDEYEAEPVKVEPIKAEPALKEEFIKKK